MKLSSRKLRAPATIVAGALFILFLSASLVSAQTFRGTILGTVTDQSGAVIVGAKISAKNTATGVERTTESSTDGSYRIPELQIGTYEVAITQTGFQTSVTKDVTVEVAKETHVDASLKPGEISQRVEVSAESTVAVETSSNILGGSFESKEVTDLPINGRDYTKLLYMVPGAAGEPHAAGDSPGSYGQFSVNGNRGRANNFLLDGTDMNDGYRNLPAINQGGVFGTPGTVLPLESIAELKVLSNFEPEFGRSAGSVVNIVTKSGANQLHGNVSEYFRNSVLNARNFFNTIGPKDAFRNNQFGASLGGPIIKDRTFFFVAYEGQREGMGITSLNTVPALSDFQTAIAAIPGSNPALCNPGGNIFSCVTNQPAGVINPVILNLFNFCNTSGKCSGGHDIWPAANLATTPGGFNSVAPAPATNNLDSFIVKIDHTMRHGQQLSGRYFYGNSNQSFPLGTGGGNNLPRTNTFSPIRTQLVSISLVSPITPHITNEVRFGWNRYRNGFYADDRSVFGNPEATLHLNNGVTDSRDFGLPTLRFGTFAFLGSSPYATPRNRVDTNWQFIDGFSWKAGKHDQKFGIEYHRTAVNSFNDFSARGVLVFNTLQNFVEGTPKSSVLFASRTINTSTDRSAAQNSLGLYVQDSFHWTKNFTLNYGVRWDYFGVIHEDHGRFSVADTSPTAPFLLVHRDPLYDKDWNNFAPRASFAWDVNGKGKTVVRAGMGMVYDNFSQDAFTGQIYANSFNDGVAYNAIAPDPVFLNKTLNSPFLVPDLPVFVPGGNAQTTDASTVDKHMRTPYVFNYNLNIQQEIARNTVFQIGYVGSAGRKLLRVHDINQPTVAQIDAADLANSCGLPPPNAGLSCILDFGAPRNVTTLLSSLAPNSAFIINQLEASATSNYNSLQTSLQQRNWHGLTQQILYTWSHSIDTASDSQDFVPNGAVAQDNTNIRADKGPSNFDVRNRFIWSADYAFPKWDTLGRMGEGWSLSAVLNVMSGHPFSMNYNGVDDYSGGGGGFDRPDIIAKPTYNYSDPAHFLDLSAFKVPCTLLPPTDPRYSGDGFADSCTAGTRHFGSLGRNALMAPHYRNFDLAITKDTKVTERIRVMFRADFYNLFNHPNFSNPLMPAFIADAAPNRSNGTPPSATFCGPNTPNLPIPTGINPNTGVHCGFMSIVATPDAGVGNPFLGGGGPRSVQFALKLTF